MNTHIQDLSSQHMKAGPAYRKSTLHFRVEPGNPKEPANKLYIFPKNNIYEYVYHIMAVTIKQQRESRKTVNKCPILVPKR